MSIEIRLLLIADLPVLERVAEEVFDGPVERHWATDFLKDSRHQHLVVAVDDGVVVGMVSAVDHVHPDKPPQLWSNEPGVAPTHRRRGIGRQLLQALLTHERQLGCTEAWLGTESDNLPARALYEQAGSAPEPFVLYTFPLAATAVGPGAFPAVTSHCLRASRARLRRG